MKLIVGLGNPGKQYEGTRHNVGFAVIRELVRRHFPAERPRSKFFAEFVAGRIAGCDVLLVYPLTFMNESGKSVRQIVDFYRIEADDLLVVCDDFNLPLGRIRLRASGSAGGQNGLDDILRRLGNDRVPRLRIGIGPLPAGWVAANFVLSRFAATEQVEVDRQVQRSADACETWLAEGLLKTMTRFNAKGADDSAERPPQH